MKNRKVQIIAGNGNPFRAKSIGRNEPCPCKSGKKVKNCCKFETRYFSKKTKEEIEAEAEKAKTDQLMTEKL